MKYLLLLLLSFNSYADTKWIDGELYGNVCRQGNVYSVRYDQWGLVGSTCNLLRIDGTVFGIGKITHE